MVKVHMTDNPSYIAEDEIIVRLPDYKYLTFDINSDYIINEIESGIGEETLWNFICCCDEHDDILNSAIRKGLTTLSYTLYITTDSIVGTVKKLNSLDLEEVVLLMICDDVIDEFRALYEDYKKR